MSKVLSRIKPAAKYLPDFLLLLTIVSLQIYFVLQYYARERYIYFYDIGGFENIVNNLAVLFPHQWQQLLAQLKSSLPTDYNYYYTLPLIPLVQLLGPNRLHYLISVVVLYQIPCMLLVGYLFRQLVEKRARLFFWIAVLIAALLPSAWSPSLRGYPDIGGTLFICLALGIYLRHDPHQRWWQYLLSGFCLCLLYTSPSPRD